MSTTMPENVPDVGDLIPALELRGEDGQPVAAGGLLGKTLLIAFLPQAGDERASKLLEGISQRGQELRALGATVLAVCPQPMPQPESQRENASMFVDSGGKLFASYGVALDSPGPTVLLIPPSLRIARRYVNPDEATFVDHLLADVRRLVEREPERRVHMHAPVLIVADVLPPQLCTRLIEIWQTQGNVDSGSMVQRDGQTVPVYNYNHKIRRDHFMQAGPDEEEVKKYIGRRLLPEMRKAFNYAVTRREDFRIACYDSSRGGYFRPHRDNTTAGTAHRRFAMSLLLNDDYEGGYLRFPEYGPLLYRPDAGAAVIFSCSLLHEATDVTAGRRFVLLSFFYGEAEAKIREEYNKRTGGQYRA